MNTYTVNVLIKVTIEAPDSEDALEVIGDCFGDCAGVQVDDLEVLDIEQLT